MGQDSLPFQCSFHCAEIRVDVKIYPQDSRDCSIAIS